MDRIFAFSTPLDTVRSIARRIRETTNGATYVVGGYVRNALLGIASTGIPDLTTDLTPERFHSLFPKAIPIGFGIFALVENGERFEIATFRRDIAYDDHRRPTSIIPTRDIREDALRRDFTVNALYYDSIEDRIIDPLGQGLSDINARILRCVRDAHTTFREDALRLLRYVRFASMLGLTTLPEEEAIARIRSPDLVHLPIERIRQEFETMLASPQIRTVLHTLQRLGILTIIFPEVAALADTEGSPPYHCEGSVLVHTALVVEALETLGCHDLDIRYAALLHDIGKASTISWEGKRAHYTGHESLSTRLFRENIAQRWRWGRRSCDRIAYLIAEHGRISQLLEMHPIKSRNMMLHPYFSDLFILYRADGMGRIPVRSPKKTLDMEAFYHTFLDREKTLPYLTGDDILRQYPTLSGRAIGERLQQENERIFLRSIT